MRARGERTGQRACAPLATSVTHTAPAWGATTRRATPPPSPTVPNPAALPRLRPSARKFVESRALQCWCLTRMPRVAVVVRVAAICSATLAAAINATTAPALAPAYPVDKEVAGARVRVLGEFEFDLPAEGAAGLALGYVLEIKTPAVPVRRAGGGDGSFAAALQQVIGLKITLPYGAWPADTAAVPSLVVVDPAAAGPGGPWAADSSMVLHGPILVIEPADLALSKVAQLLKACCVLCLLP
jgi:hypothetical protein